LPQRAFSPRPSIDDPTRLLPLHGYPAATVAPLPGSDPSTVRRGILRLNAEGASRRGPALAAAPPEVGPARASAGPGGGPLAPPGGQGRPGCGPSPRRQPAPTSSPPSVEVRAG